MALTMCLCCSCSGMEPGRPAMKRTAESRRVTCDTYLCHLPLKVAGKLDLGAAACSHYGTYRSDL